VEAALRFRDATADDVDAVVALVESAYRGAASRRGWTTEADFLEGQRTDAADVDTCIRRERSRIVLAERDGELLACAHVSVDGAAGHFGMFAVRPSHQGSAIGKQLLAEGERIVRDEWAQPSMRMHVIDIRAELIAFYERRGYRRTGIVAPFPYGDERFGVPLRDDLRFELLEKDLRHG